jgi:hypothetical protein
MHVATAAVPRFLPRALERAAASTDPTIADEVRGRRLVKAGTASRYLSLSRRQLEYLRELGVVRAIWLDRVCRYDMTELDALIDRISSHPRFDDARGGGRATR